MRVFKYEVDGFEVVMNEDQILEEHRPVWVENMLGRFSIQYIRENFTNEDIILDWINLRWATEVVE